MMISVKYLSLLESLIFFFCQILLQIPAAWTEVAAPLGSARGTEKMLRHILDRVQHC